jgi:hypothetical protein
MIMENTTIPKLLTPAAVAEILNVKETTLAVWRSTNRYNMNYVKSGKKVMYPANAVQRFIDERTRAHTK